MPITPRAHVWGCYEAAKRHVQQVNIGNQQLLGLG